MIGEAPRTGASPTPRRRFPGGRLAAVIAVALLAVAACGPSSPASSDPPVLGGADAVRAEIARAQQETALPPGMTYPPIEIRDDEQFQAGYGTQRVQHLALCSWYRAWLDGLQRGDAEAVAGAVAASASFRTWELYTLADVSFRQLTDDVLAAAELGDALPMRMYVEGNCD